MARERSPALDRYLRVLQSPCIDFSDQLRQLRHTAWIRATLATLFQSHSAQEICLFWSHAAEQILSKAWDQHGLAQEPICLVAMGKLGAMELNLSSDIDIFFVSDADPTKSMLKKVRQFLNDLSDIRSTGFCFRVDLDLRPGGSTSPLIVSFDQMTNHYGYQGETWERVAMIRQKIILGPQPLTEKIYSFCKKFSFRKHIDYSLFHDLYSMRKKIQNHKFNTTPWNIKFRKGGIRDLELLVHSLQLIHGGKNKKLMTGSITQALDELELAQHLNSADAKTLRESYWFFREIENKIQCENDQHTYDLSTCTLVSPEHKALFETQTQRISLIVDQFLKPYKKENASQTVPLDQEFRSLDLRSEDAEKAWFQLLQTKLQSRSRQRDDEERQLFLKNVLNALKTCRVDPPMALHHLQQFIVAIKAKTTFFTLFNQHRELIEELIWIFSCSPFLAQILIHRPELVDSFLLKTAAIDSQDEDQFYSSAQDYKLLSDLISSSQFLRQRDVEQLTRNLSQTTDTIVLTLLQILKDKFKVDVTILSLGKWAAREMGLTSDLDFIFLTDVDPQAAHFKMARRFIHFLSSPHSGQTLYNIDLRLRPSGSAGPLLISKKDLSEYLETKAEIWERQAYLCYRQIPATEQKALFSARPLTQIDRDKLSEIQRKLLTDGTDVIDLKKNRGGLLHTELTLQLAVLDRGLFPTSANVKGLCEALMPFMDRILCEQIQKNYLNLRSYQQLLILVSQSAESCFYMDSQDLLKLSSLLQTPPKVVLQTLQELLAQQKTILNKLDPLVPGLKIDV